MATSLSDTVTTGDQFEAQIDLDMLHRYKWTQKDFHDFLYNKGFKVTHEYQEGNRLHLFALSSNQYRGRNHIEIALPHRANYTENHPDHRMALQSFCERIVLLRVRPQRTDDLLVASRNMSFFEREKNYQDFLDGKKKSAYQAASIPDSLIVLL